MTGRSPMMAANFAEGAEQEVRTPPDVIARIVRAFGGHSIALDPCAPTRSAPSFHADRYVREAENGLLFPWVDRTYANPPFADLAPWLEKAHQTAREAEAEGLCPRIALLVPARTHRAWFQDALISCTRHNGAATFLRPVKFVGHKGAFPAPLALLSWNCVVEGPAVAAFRRGIE